MSAITRATCSLFLKNLNREVWEERRNIAKAKAEMTQENEEAVASRTRVSRTKAIREQSTDKCRDANAWVANSSRELSRQNVWGSDYCHSRQLG